MCDQSLTNSLRRTGPITAAHDDTGYMLCFHKGHIFLVGEPRPIN